MTIFKLQMHFFLTSPRVGVAHLREQFVEVLKQVGAVKVTVVIYVELCDKAGDSPELHDGLEGHLLHLIGHFRVL